MPRVFSFLSAAALMFAAYCAVAQPAAVVAQDAWVRVTPGSDVAAAYLTLRNTGSKPVTIVEVESPAASMTMIHETTMQNGVSRMRPHESLVIAPGKTVKFEPGGLHIMLHGLTQPLAPGKTVPLKLRLSDGTSLEVVATVRPLDAQ